jgi:hypothetical protein
VRHVVAVIGRSLDTATDSERVVQMTTLLVRMFDAPAWATIAFCAITLYLLDLLMPSTKHVTFFKRGTFMQTSHSFDHTHHCIVLYSIEIWLEPC